MHVHLSRVPVLFLIDHAQLAVVGHGRRCTLKAKKVPCSNAACQAFLQYDGDQHGLLRFSETCAVAYEIMMSWLTTGADSSRDTTVSVRVQF
jgi:hypothetical protein